MRHLACRLAWEFGEPDVDRFLESIDVQQLFEWAEFLALEMGVGALELDDTPKKTPDQMACILRTFAAASQRKKR